jgi:hypothetical protein
MVFLCVSQDDEDGNTYEAPPCERPAMKVPPRHVEENVYLGNTTTVDYPSHLR